MTKYKREPPLLNVSETILNLKINDGRISHFSLEWIIYSSWHQTGDKITKLFSKNLEIMNSLMSSDSIEYTSTYMRHMRTNLGWKLCLEGAEQGMNILGNSTNSDVTLVLFISKHRFF